jgi:cytosine/adenosine deaminase-related metal-dependent hydrolase
VHIHLAEDPCDEEKCSSEHQMFLADRLRAHGLLHAPMIFAHGTHLTDADVASIAQVGATIAHNARSNMNNSVGYAFIQRMLGTLPVMMGTDGIGSDMLAEMRTAYFKACDEQTGLGPAEIIGMLAQSARRASQSLEVELGRLEPGCAADIVVTDHIPATPMTDDNVAGHLVFSLGARHVKDVMIGGQWRLRDRAVVGLDEPAVRCDAAVVAADLWGRMQQ